MFSIEIVHLLCTLKDIILQTILLMRLISTYAKYVIKSTVLDCVIGIVIKKKLINSNYHSLVNSYTITVPSILTGLKRSFRASKSKLYVIRPIKKQRIDITYKNSENHTTMTHRFGKNEARCLC